MISNFFRHSKGAVGIRISGKMPERFINLCIAERIHLWGLRKNEDGLSANLLLRDFFRIRPLVRISKCRVRVVHRRGIPFIWKYMRNRKVFVLGPAIFTILLYLATSYIWFVTITGAESLATENIRGIAAKYGLRVGGAKSNIDVRHIENEFMLNMPEIAWIGISLEGVRANIDIVEKKFAKMEDRSPAHVIAAKDGVVTEIIVLSGQANIKKGDTVKRGDILIRGEAPELPIGTTGTGEGAMIPVRGKGIIKARVWYEGYGEANTLRMIYKKNGNHTVGMTIKLNGKEYVWKGSSSASYEAFQKEVIYKKLLEWRNSGADVELTINNYFELVGELTEISAEEAQAVALAQANENIQKVIPEAAQVLARKQQILHMTEKYLFRAKVGIETLEDIAQTSNVH